MRRACKSHKRLLINNILQARKYETSRSIIGRSNCTVIHLTTPRAHYISLAFLLSYFSVSYCTSACFFLKLRVRIVERTKSRVICQAVMGISPTCNRAVDQSAVGPIRTDGRTDISLPGNCDYRPTGLDDVAGLLRVSNLIASSCRHVSTNVT